MRKFIPSKLRNVQLLELDSHAYLQRLTIQPETNIIPNSSASSNSFSNSNNNHSASRSVSTNSNVISIDVPDFDIPKAEADPENHIITKQDLENLSPQFYDAFVLYDEDEITHLAQIQEIVRKLNEMKFSVSLRMKSEFFVQFKSSSFASRTEIFSSALTWRWKQSWR